MGYKLNDNDVLNAIIKAKNIVENSATAREIMEVVKMILHYEVNVKEDIQYIVKGICRKTVFEYTKRRVGRKFKINVYIFRCIHKILKYL